MKCGYCKEGELIEGTLEGVSFQPKSEHKRWFSSGVYGIKTTVCMECGRLSNLSLDKKVLEKIVKK